MIVSVVSRMVAAAAVAVVTTNVGMILPYLCHDLMEFLDSTFFAAYVAFKIHLVGCHVVAFLCPVVKAGEAANGRRRGKWLFMDFLLFSLSCDDVLV